MKNVVFFELDDSHLLIFPIFVDGFSPLNLRNCVFFWELESFVGKPQTNIHPDHTPDA